MRIRTCRGWQCVCTLREGERKEQACRLPVSNASCGFVYTYQFLMQISSHQTLGTLHQLPGSPAHILQKKGMRHHSGDLSSNQGLPGWSAGRMLSPSQMVPFGLGQEQKNVTIDNMNVRSNFEAHFCNNFFLHFIKNYGWPIELFLWACILCLFFRKACLSSS